MPSGAEWEGARQCVARDGDLVQQHGGQANVHANHQTAAAPNEMPM